MVHNKGTYHLAPHPHHHPIKAVPSNISTSSASDHHRHHGIHGPPIPITEQDENSASSFLVCGKKIEEGIRFYIWITVTVAFFGLLSAGYSIHHLNVPTHDTETLTNDYLFSILFIASTLWFGLSVLLLIIGVINEDRRLCVTWIAAMTVLILMWISYLCYSIITSISESLSVGAVIIFTLYLAHGIWVAIHFIQYINEKKKHPPEQVHRYSDLVRAIRQQTALRTLQNTKKHSSVSSSHSHSSRNSSSKGAPNSHRDSSSRTLNDSTSSQDNHLHRVVRIKSITS
ncbi:unnamed protein product [Orchesella dallaii]|uniref:DUF7027 domain-containing protein n=1 Tax=Orchesella dallaii TaxID=48710 RepID=A0ABP1Q623_9HEXA